MTQALSALTGLTPRNLDSEIEHLERVLAKDAANSLFGRTYWRNRVVKARATLGVGPSQGSRLERLLFRVTNQATHAG
ncbi:conserved hypothetical protein [Burkholderia sp. 8Y]|nr:conserved hypothetical protein [Burkholderia sp. 8Y]